MSGAAATGGGRAPLGLLLRAGGLALLGYGAYFVLLQSATLWAAPVPLPDLLAAPGAALAPLLPAAWRTAAAGSPAALLNAGLYLGLVIALFAVYARLLAQLWRPPAAARRPDRAALAVVLLVAAGALALLLLVPGTLAADLHSYAWYGRIWAVFGANPFVHRANEYGARDPGGWLAWNYWQDTPTVYGPLWVILAGAIARMAQALGGAFAFDLLGHKLLASAAHLANILLLWHVAGRLGAPAAVDGAPAPAIAQPGARLAATVTYAWNPLALIEFGANGHNDVLLLTGLLAALALHLAGYWRPAVLALAAASLIKVTALLWLPGYLWLLVWLPAGPRGPARQAGLGRVGQALGLTVALWLGCYLPFWAGAATLAPLTTGPAVSRYINSLGALVRLKLPGGLYQLAVASHWQPDGFWHLEGLPAVLEWGIRGVALTLTTLVAAAQTWPRRTLRGLLGAWGWITFAYLAVGAVWFWPWYVTWLLVPLALVGPGRLQRAGLIFCATSLALYTLYPIPAPALAELSAWRALLVFGPPLGAALLWHAPARRRRVRQPTGAQSRPAAGNRMAGWL
ncbi:MAG TPA: hypothetical protein VKY74_21675 [Chloroflexia bacterium]|nr:hypothetical protein [Chloroflexia bacterium]